MVPINRAERTRRCSRLANHARFKHGAFERSSMRLFLIGEPRRHRGRCFYPFDRACGGAKSISSNRVRQPLSHISWSLSWHDVRVSKNPINDVKVSPRAIVAFGVHLSAFKIMRRLSDASTLRRSANNMLQSITFFKLINTWQIFK